MAKVKKPLLPPRNFDPSVFNKSETTLPTPETVTNAAALLTGKTIDAPKVEIIAESVDNQPIVEAETIEEELKPTISEKVEKEIKEKKKSKTVRATKAEKEKVELANDKTNRVGITALIDRTLLKKVKIYALEEGVSMSDVCNWALMEYLTKKK